MFPHNWLAVQPLSNKSITNSKRKKAAEVFLETPQATVLNKQKFYIVKPKQGEDFTLPKKWSSKTLGKTAIKALVTKGETSKLKGFKSKKGKSFDAKLKLDGHKLSFDFD